MTSKSHKIANVSVNYLQNVLKVFPGGVYWKDKNGVYLECNQFIADCLKVASPAEVIGKTDYDFLPKKVAEYARQTEKKVMGEGATHRNGRIYTIERWQITHIIRNKNTFEGF